MTNCDTAYTANPPLSTRAAMLILLGAVVVMGALLGCASDRVGTGSTYSAEAIKQENASPTSLVQISPGENGGSTTINTIGPAQQAFVDAETGNLKVIGGGVANKTIALPTGGGKFPSRRQPGRRSVRGSGYLRRRDGQAHRKERQGHHQRQRPDQGQRGGDQGVGPVLRRCPEGSPSGQHREVPGHLQVNRRGGARNTRRSPGRVWRPLNPRYPQAIVGHSPNLAGRPSTQRRKSTRRPP
jgi:hypothetical protein